MSRRAKPAKFKAHAEKWHMLKATGVLKKLNSSESGLDTAEAKNRLARFGPNELKQEKKVSRLKVFLSQFRSFLVLILVAATLFSALIGEMVDALAILSIVIINALFGYMQEYKAEKTIEALKRLTRPETAVIREGKEIVIPSRQLVPGDIVSIGEGSRVTADMRLLKTSELRIDESAMTGESSPVYKDVKVLGDVPMADRKNMLWAGTMATYGRGTAVVTGTGMNTEIGRIAHIVEKEGEEPTPLQENLDTFGKRLGMMILAICAIVIVIGVLRGSVFTNLPVTQDLVVTMIITGIALAVAAIPEGLPAVVTITLALGLQRLAGHNALIRRLPSVETLGSTTVICADKTGTLTKNEMTVRKIWVSGKSIDVGGDGYEPRGEFLSGSSKIYPRKNKQLSMLLRAGTLCSNARLGKGREGGATKWEITGDPTEGAIVVAAAKAGIDINELERQNPRTREIPFSSERKMMTTINRMPGKGLLVCTKGAPEVVLGLCTRYADGKTKRITPAFSKSMLKANKQMAEDALRVLAVAYKKLPSGTSNDNVEKGLVFAGLVGMMDPPRNTVKRDIELCRRAGIKVAMITGDHKDTAMAVANRLDMKDHGTRVIIGAELDSMTQKQLEGAVNDTLVYARVNPEHKLKIVSAFREKGHVIAMTGDGVNDAPALKGADIGIAMGIKGTDVAKEASDMILRDDNFSSIVRAVHTGRGIYDNIKKFIQYLLSSNLGEVLIVFIAMLIGLGYADPETSVFIPILGALQLLWINIVTDGLPALALGVDPPSSGIMKRKPRNPNEKILSGEMLLDIIIVGIIICTGTLFLFWLNMPAGGVLAATVAFTTIVMFEMVRVQSVRMKYHVGLWSNKKLIGAMVFSIALQLMIIYVPFFQPIFNTTPLGWVEWLEIAAISSTILIAMQAKTVLSKRGDESQSPATKTR